VIRFEIAQTAVEMDGLEVGGFEVGGFEVGGFEAGRLRTVQDRPSLTFRPKNNHPALGGVVGLAVVASESRAAN